MRQLSQGLEEEDPLEREGEREKQAWEKVVMDTANSRLGEMKTLKKELDAAIEAKVKKGLEAEYRKISALISSKSALLSEKISSDMEGKHKEIDQLLDQRVKEIVRVNEGMKKTFSGLSEWEKKYARMRSELTEIEKNIEGVRAGGLSQLQIQKKQSLDEMMGLIERANHDLKEFIDKTKKELQAQKDSTEKEILAERQEITKSLREEREKRIRELQLELEEKRDKTVERLDEIVGEKLSTTEKEFSGLKAKLFTEIEAGL